MKNVTKLADLTDLNVVEKPEEVKGGFFFFLFKGFNYGYGYQAPKNNYGYGYQAPKNNYYGGGKKGY